MSREITAEALAERLRGATPPLLLDVRNGEDYGREPGMIPGAVKRELEALAEWAPSLPKERPIVVYCQHGKRISNLVLDDLLARGLSAHLLEGGMDGWNDRAAQPS